MIWIIVIGILVGLAVIAGSFVAGAVYGRKSERKATNYLRSVLDAADKKVE